VTDVADIATSIELEAISAGAFKMQTGSLILLTSEEDTEATWYKCDLPTATDQQVHLNDSFCNVMWQCCSVVLFG